MNIYYKENKMNKDLKLVLNNMTTFISAMENRLSKKEFNEKYKKGFYFPTDIWKYIISFTGCDDEPKILKLYKNPFYTTYRLIYTEEHILDECLVSYKGDSWSRPMNNLKNDNYWYEKYYPIWVFSKISKCFHLVSCYYLKWNTSTEKWYLQFQGEARKKNLEDYDDYTNVSCKFDGFIKSRLVDIRAIPQLKEIIFKTEGIRDYMKNYYKAEYYPEFI